jgi:hypothetical protein
LDLAAVPDSDRVEAMNSDGVAVIDSDVVAVIDQEMVGSDRMVAIRIDSDLMAIGSTMMSTRGSK